MGQQGTRTVVLDAGAIIAFERAQRKVVLLIETIRAGNERIVVPAGVLGQVWRDASRQARVAALIGDRRTRVDALDIDAAKAAGVICGRARTRAVIDASVVVTARTYAPSVVVTGDAADLRRLDPSLDVQSV